MLALTAGAYRAGHVQRHYGTASVRYQTRRKPRWHRRLRGCGVSDRGPDRPAVFTPGRSPDLG